MLKVFACVCAMGFIWAVFNNHDTTAICFGAATALFFGWDEREKDQRDRDTYILLQSSIDRLATPNGKD